MKNKKRYTIAIVTGNTQSDYSAKLISGFCSAAKDSDINILLLTEQELPTYCIDINDDNTGNYRYQFHSIYQYAPFLKPDAAIITYSSISAFTSDKQKKSFLEIFSDIPHLMIEDTSPDENIPSIFADNYNGISICVKHLIHDHGYKKIAFLSGPANNFDAQKRLQAYLDTMAEYQLKVSDTMIAYGDYTDCVDKEAQFLLQNNPGLEAIVCANDAMAKSCYRICTLQNLIVGKDIAITGFDDIASAATMHPPLTSVSQNIFELGYEALKAAISLCKGEPIFSCTTMPVSLQKRCSCGCMPADIFPDAYFPGRDIKTYMQGVLAEMEQHLFSSVSKESERKYLGKSLSDYFSYIYTMFFSDTQEIFSMEYLLKILKKIAMHPAVSSTLLTEDIVKLLHFLQDNLADNALKNRLSTIISSTQQFIHSLDIEKLENEIISSHRKAWFVPTFTKGLENATLEESFTHLMAEMKKMQIHSTYIFLFEKPVIHQPDKPLLLPEYIYLTAYFNSESMAYIGKNESYAFSTKNGISAFIDNPAASCMTTALLFSGQKQYGIMVCEIDCKDIAFLQICSLQIGTFLHFKELTYLERQAQKKLQNSLQAIEEKNKILSFLSENDTLTNLLNRRGFIEHAFTLCKNNINKTGYMIFGDLDHLKEINDVYGHVEGDFAIKSIAQRFLSLLPADAICGRIGGDEYVALVFSEDKDFQKQIKQAFTDENEIFNRNCSKPYYIELSLGIYQFTCEKDIQFNEIIQKSDELLYEAKSKRRKSVKK